MTQPKPPLAYVIAPGRFPVHAAVRGSGKCPALEFLRDLEKIKKKGKDKPEANAMMELMATFSRMAQIGRLKDTKFSKEAGRLFGFKGEVQNLLIRFPCFQDGAIWVLTHGFFKPGAQKGRGSWPASEIDRANEIMAEYLKRKGEQS